jgi:D-alanyl-D-alanine carboxypeptidase (penicillin-binding protein 5/6)
MHARRIIMLIAALILTTAASASALSARRIPAKAAVVMDSTGAVLFSKFPDAKLQPASTVKLVTAMVVLDLLQPETRVQVSRHAAKTHSIPPRLHEGDEATVSSLLHVALMKSVNSAAVTLAEAAAGSEDAFTDLMNKKARDIGATNTRFANASGLPKSGQYSTANDLALILRAALSYPLIREILATKEYAFATREGRIIVIENSNELLWRNDKVIGGKTGYTGDARHCFVCAINTDKGPCYTAVLGARSRSSLWRSTMLLAEFVTNPLPARATGKASSLRNTAFSDVKYADVTVNAAESLR